MGEEAAWGSVHLLLAAHTPAPQPGGSCTAPGDAEPGRAAGGMALGHTA